MTLILGVKHSHLGNDETFSTRGDYAGCLRKLSRLWKKFGSLLANTCTRAYSCCTTWKSRGNNLMFCCVLFWRVLISWHVTTPTLTTQQINILIVSFYVLKYQYIFIMSWQMNVFSSKSVKYLFIFYFGAYSNSAFVFSEDITYKSRSHDDHICVLHFCLNTTNSHIY